MNIRYVSLFKRWMWAAILTGMVGDAASQILFSSVPSDIVVATNGQFSTDISASTGKNNAGAFRLRVAYDPLVLQMRDATAPLGGGFSSNVFARVDASAGVAQIAGFQTSSSPSSNAEVVLRITWRAIGTNGSSSSISIMPESIVDFCWYPVKAFGSLSLAGLDSSDTDQDGIPDWWATKFFGGPTNVLATALDPVTGLSYMQEFLGDIVPGQKDTVPAIDSVLKREDGLVLSFGTSRSRLYDLQWSTNLFSGTWTPICAGIQGLGGMTSVTDTNTMRGVRFYRVRVRIP